MAKPKKFCIVVGIIGLLLAVSGCKSKELIQATAAVEAMNLKLDKLEDAGGLDPDTIAAMKGAATAVEFGIQKAAEGPAEALGTAGDIAGAILPPPWGTLLSSGLGLAAAGLGLRARKNLVAGRKIASHMELASELSEDGKIDLSDPKVKKVLTMMGPHANRIVAEGKGRETGIGI